MVQRLVCSEQSVTPTECVQEYPGFAELTSYPLFTWQSCHSKESWRIPCFSWEVSQSLLIVNIKTAVFAVVFGFIPAVNQCGWFVRLLSEQQWVGVVLLLFCFCFLFLWHFVRPILLVYVESQIKNYTVFWKSQRTKNMRWISALKLLVLPL